MSCRESETKQQLKKGLQVICYVSEAALSVAAGVFGWMNSGATLLGAAVAIPVVGLIKDATNGWNPQSNLEEEYFEVVEAALESTKAQFLNKPGKIALLNELSDRVNEINMDLTTVIKNTETYQTQYMTMIDTQEILLVFESAFDRELAKHERLYRYYSIRTGKNTLDLLKRVHVIVTADSKKMDQIFEYVKESRNDTAQIKEEVHQIKTGMDYLKYIAQGMQNTLCFLAEILLQSMVIFFAFTVATALLNIQSENSMMIYIVVLISEFLIRSLLVRVKGFRTVTAVVVTQTLFITTCSLLFSRQYINMYPETLLYLAGCASVGVSLKYCLLYFQTNHTER